MSESIYKAIAVGKKECGVPAYRGELFELDDIHLDCWIAI